MTMYDEESDGLISKAILKVIGPKKRWRAYKARVRQLPEGYRMAVEAIERYLMHFGAMDAGSAESLFEDVADLFERAAADGTPIREIVGEDPVEFVEALIANYEKGGYVTRERNRLIAAIDRAAAENAGNEGIPGNHEQGGHANREQNRLSTAVEHAAGENTSEDKGTV
jgi:DNA-binding ferritin-like protein (Dps family)